MSARTANALPFNGLGMHAEMLTSDSRRLERAELLTSAPIGERAEMLKIGHVAYLRGAISRP